MDAASRGPEHTQERDSARPNRFGRRQPSMNETLARTANDAPHIDLEWNDAGREFAAADDGATVDFQATGAARAADSIDARSASSSLEIGCVLRGRYVLEERLGSANSTVFKALDRYRADLPGTQQYVAIKILRAASHDGIERLAKARHEFYCAQMLSDRNIVKVFELDRDGDVEFFTMEFLDGQILGDVMERLHPLPLSRPQAWALIREIGSGLEHAHARNVIHAGLKPQNIVVTHSGEVRILDFGACSSSAYASCEILEGRPPDPRDDIYALACLSYELLAGSHPFQRRRSTEARDLGIEPQRPPQLSRQQWQTLRTGLSWHRGGRSIPVRSWLKKLNIDQVAAEKLSAGHELVPEPAAPRPAASFKATALFLVLLITATFWVSVVRLAPNRKVGGDNLGSPAVAHEPLRAESGAQIEGAGLRGKQLAAAATRDASSTASQVQPRTANDASREDHRSKLPAGPTNPMVISANSYRVRSGEHFVEIRVHRSARSASGTPFVWWTEAASAKPGVDYVPQGKVTQSFPSGKSWTSFFVKLVPNAPRTQPAVFYIAIAEADRISSAGHSARAEVWLPSHDNRSTANAARGDPNFPTTAGGLLSHQAGLVAPR
jgi:serine/threonine protein kinase